MTITRSYMDYVGRRNCMNGLDLLSLIPENEVAVCFADFQYRGVLDALSYGNEGERQSGRSELQQMDEETIQSFCDGISQVLRPSGHLFLWVDTWHLVQGSVHEWFPKDPVTGKPGLDVVGLLTWNKESFGMGYRLRSTAEYLLILQKLPKRAKGVWKDRSIRDIWTEKIPSPRSKKLHPHRKPIALMRKLIECVTDENDLILDPCAGSFLVKAAAEDSKRLFIGCDIDPVYCGY